MYLGLKIFRNLISTFQDINFKITRQNSATIVKTSIQNHYPWKLQQVQDASNHLQQALYHIDDVGKNYKFKYIYKFIVKNVLMDLNANLIL